MPSFYEQLPLDIAESIEPLNRLSYELREHRKTLLELYDVTEADKLLAKIEAGEIPEIPAYNHYVSILILAEQHEHVRAQLKSVMAQKNEDSKNAPLLLHAKIKAQLDEVESALFGVTTELFQDALLVYLANGVEVEIRFADEKQYAINWRWGDALLYINTAPLYPHLSTYPNHFCDANSDSHADKFINPDIDPWDNVLNLLKRLARDPLLEERHS